MHLSKLESSPTAVAGVASIRFDFLALESEPGEDNILSGV